MLHKRGGAEQAGGASLALCESLNEARGDEAKTHADERTWPFCHKEPQLHSENLTHHAQRAARAFRIDLGPRRAAPTATKE